MPALRERADEAIAKAAAQLAEPVGEIVQRHRQIGQEGVGALFCEGAVEADCFGGLGERLLAAAQRAEHGGEIEQRHRQIGQEGIGALLADQINITAAVVFYLLYVAGIVIFAISPALESGSWRTALTMGALFGFFAYATYDMTNLATLRDWPVAVTAVDMAWGTFSTGLSATAGFLAAKYFI